MGFIVSAVTAGDSKVSVVLETADAAIAKILEYKEAGLTGILVKDMDGKPIDLDAFAAVASQPNPISNDDA